MVIWKVKLKNSDDKEWYTRYITSDGTGEAAGQAALKEIDFPCEDVVVEQVKKACKNSLSPAEKAVIQAERSARNAALAAKKMENEKLASSLNTAGWVLIAVSFIGWILCFKFAVNNGHGVSPAMANKLWLIAFSMSFIAYFGCNKIYYACAFSNFRAISGLYLITPAVFAIPFMAVWNAIFGFKESPEATGKARVFALFACIPYIVFAIFCWCVPILQPDPRGGYIANPQILGFGISVAAIPSVLVALWLGWDYWRIQDDLPTWYKPTFWGLWFWAILPFILWFMFCRGGEKKGKEKGS